MKLNKFIVISLLLIPILSLGLVCASDNISDSSVNNLDDNGGILTSDVDASGDGSLFNEVDDSGSGSACVSGGSVGGCSGSACVSDLNSIQQEDYSNITYEDLSDLNLKSSLQSNQVSAPSYNFSALQGLVDKTSDNGSINLTSDFYGSGKEISISKPLEINGNGVTLDANGLSKIFKISSKTTLRDIVFKNALSNSMGGAILLISGKCTLINCSFINCSSSASGGAIGASSAISLINCSFINCSALQGGALNLHSYGSFINGSSFVNCSASYGGAIRTYVGNLSIENCSFIDLKSKANGGVINLYNSTCLISDSSFNSIGTAFYSLNSNSSLSNCSFSDCHTLATTALMDYDEYDNPNIIRGIFYSYNSSSSLDACDFLNSYARKGGAVFLSNESFISLKNCNIINSSADLATAYSINGTFNMLNSTFVDCPKGAIYAYYSNSSISNCSFINCDSIHVNIGEVGMFRRHGVIYSVNGSCSVMNSSFLDCFNGIYSNTNSSVGYCSFVNCSNIYSGDLGYDGDGGGEGSAIYFENQDSTVFNSTFINCSNMGYYGLGGAICGGNAYDCSFINCSGQVSEGLSFGGAAYDCHLDNCSFINCSAFYGGAVCFYKDNSSVNDCSFINCSAYGGGAIFLGYLDNLNISNCSFFKCSSNSGGEDLIASGGAISLFDCSNVNISKCDFFNCSLDAIFCNDVDKKCTNISVISSDFLNCSLSRVNSVYNCSFKDCYSPAVIDSYTIGNCSFINCHNAIDSSYLSEDVNIFNSRFVNCSRDDDPPMGGAIKIVYIDNIRIYNCEFVNCSVTGNEEDVPSGGAISCEWTKNAKIFNSSFYNCFASYCGGAISSFVENIFSIYNCSFRKCSAPYDKYVPSNANVTNCYFDIPIASKLIASKVTATYGVSKNLVVTLKDGKGNIIKGKKVTIKVGTISKTLKTNDKGQVSVTVSSLVPKTYTATIRFAGDDNYAKSSKTVTVVVKKASPKINAAKKTFKRTAKSKYYSITLKNNKNKAMNKYKVSIKVNGKTYSATTNSKGIAKFNLKNLKKKGSFKATITYAGNKYYNKVTKTVYIVIK